MKCSLVPTKLHRRYPLRLLLGLHPTLRQAAIVALRCAKASEHPVILFRGNDGCDAALPHDDERHRRHRLRRPFCQADDSLTRICANHYVSTADIVGGDGKGRHLEGLGIDAHVQFALERDH